MKILIVGAAGRLGTAIAEALKHRHEIIGASRSQGVRVDVNHPESVMELYRTVGPIDAVVSAVGSVPYANVAELSREDFESGVREKLLGQIELVRQGIPNLSAGGSFTLISGILSIDPIATGSVASTVNGGIESFVRAAAIEMPRSLRINAVSPSVFEESLDVYSDYFPGFTPVKVADVARAFVKSVEGAQTGQVYRL